MAGNYLDEDTLTAIFTEFAPAIYKYALRLCHLPSVGDNIVGDAFAQLVEQFAAAQHPPPDVRLYLYQTAHRYIVKYLRESQSNPSAEPLASASDESPPQDDKEASIVALKDELTEDQLHVVILYFLEDFNLKDTATILGKNVGEIRASLEDIRRIIESHPELRTDSLAILLNKRRTKR
jgi:RNA polymerase sigma factor (sigma-70 family)